MIKTGKKYKNLLLSLSTPTTTSIIMATIDWDQDSYCEEYANYSHFLSIEFRFENTCDDTQRARIRSDFKSLFTQPWKSIGGTIHWKSDPFVTSPGYGEYPEGRFTYVTKSRLA